MDATPTLPIKTSLVALVAVVALEVAARTVLPVDAVMRVAATGALRGIEAVALVFWVSGTGPGLAAINLNREAMGSGFRSGLMWSAVFAGVAAVAGAITYFGIGADPVSLIRVTLPKALFGSVLFILVAGLMSPVTEEIFFRGVLYGVFRRWGAVPAIVGTTLLFSAAHTGTGLPVMQFAGGLVFACALEKSRSLVAPIVIHVLGNVAIYTISLIV